TIVNNTGGGTGAGLWIAGSFTITNCIVWNNQGFPGYASPDDENVFLLQPYATGSITNSDVQYSSVFPGTGNIDADPLFVDAAGGNLRLQAGSPCISTGNDAVVASPPFPMDATGTLIDLDGKPRVSRAHVDIGAYEYQNQAPTANAGA